MPLCSFTKAVYPHNTKVCTTSIRSRILLCSHICQFLNMSKFMSFFSHGKLLSNLCSDITLLDRVQDLNDECVSMNLFTFYYTCCMVASYTVNYQLQCTRSRRLRIRIF